MAYGDLGAVIDILAYQTGNSYSNECFHVVGEIYCANWREGSSLNGIATFSIDALGEISDAIIDTMNHTDDAAHSCNRLAKLTDSLYAIATTKSTYKNQLDTIEILANGQMADFPLDNHAWIDTEFFPGALKALGPGMLALFFARRQNNEGLIWTIRVYGDGTIEHALVDTMTFEPTSLANPRACNIHPGIWAVTQQGPGYTGSVRTVSISASGIIGATPIDFQIFDAGETFDPTCAKAHGNFLAIGYANAAHDGKLAIVEISESGVITDTVIDSYIFESGYAREVFTYSIGQGYIGVAYSDLGYHGLLKTFLVDENGNLNDTTIDTLDYSPGGSEHNTVMHVTGDVWAVCHQAPGPTGRVTTFGLETPPQIPGRKDLMMGVYR